MREKIALKIRLAGILPSKLKKKIAQSNRSFGVKNETEFSWVTEGTSALGCISDKLCL